MGEVLILVDHVDGKITQDHRGAPHHRPSPGEPSAVHIGPGAETAQVTLAKVRRDGSTTSSTTRPR